MTTQLKGAKSFLICNSFFLLSFLFLNFSNLEAKTFTVTNTNDSGLGSFRQAILDANAKPGKDKIEFDIPGSGPHTIKPNSALPTITDRVTIDGYSQSGAKPNRNRPGKRNNAKLKIVLNGSNVPGFTSGLHITAGKCKIRGLVIHSFSLGIFIENKGENDIEGNFIGTDVTGTDGPGNGANGLEIKGSGVKNNKVKNNVISGNGVNGILIWQGASKNRVLRNIIGAGVNGDEELGNGGNGVSMESASNNKVGGNSKKDRNLIANNETHGVLIKGASARKNRVQGNYIGADRTGKNSNGNQGDGIAIEDAPDNLIGGKKKNRGNLISGNNSDGIRIEGNDAHDNVVQGNFIGTDVQGRNAIPNDNGITLDNQCENNTVGGIRRRARNLISGNENNGIFIGVDAENNVIQGNYIGTDISGRAALGNDFAGIEVISGNNNEIGGTRRRARNIIAFNEAGVLVASGTGNAILANSIFNNNGLGIDLAEDGVTPNDPGDTDAGANNLQNFPLLTSAVIDNGKTKVAGAIDTQNPEDITLEFFANKNSDPSGHGEGQKFLGTATPNSLGE
ncbi:MAG: right-handed parallel beta-helix repeat-containing protein, partial [bacterium]